MSGKVFAESADLIEDQSKVLFDYLAQVAAKIVTEEERIEKEIATRRENLVQIAAQIQSKGSLMIGLFVGAGICIPLGFLAHPILFVVAIGLAIVAFVQLSAKKALAIQATTATTEISVFEDEFKKIRRDYKVHKIGVGFVQVATQIPFEGGSFLLDHTGTAKNQQFSLYSVKNQGEFIQNISELDQALQSLPVVESNSAMEDVNTS